MPVPGHLGVLRFGVAHTPQTASSPGRGWRSGLRFCRGLAYFASVALQGHGPLARSVFERRGSQFGGSTGRR